jgi:cell division protein FtsN
MTKTIRTILVAVTVLFIGGAIWALAAYRDQKNDEKNTATTQQVTPPNTNTEVSTPTLPDSTPSNEEVVTTPQNQATTTPQRTTVTRRYYIAQQSDTVSESFSGDAWARAGVDSEGQAYAEAHAE